MPKKPTRRQHGTGSITWLDPGKALLRVRTDAGVRSKTIRTTHRDHGGRGEAAEALTALQASLEAESRRPDQHTLAETFDEYLKDLKRRERRGGTTTSYAQIKNRLTPELAATPIGAIGPRDLEVFYGTLGDRYEQSTIRTTHQVIKAVLAAAVRWQWLQPPNPADAARVNQPRSKARRQLSPADVEVLVRSGNDQVLGMALFLAAALGLRRGELCGLRWEDVDEAEGVIWISRQWSVDHDGVAGIHELKADTGTDEQWRRGIYRGPAVFDVLNRFRAFQRDRIGREPQGWVLSEDGGTTPIKPTTLGKRATVHCHALGYEGISLHDFRRLTASELAAAGVDVTVAADQLGHTPQIMLGKYVTGRKDKAIAAGAALEERLESQGLVLADLFTKAPPG